MTPTAGSDGRYLRDLLDVRFTDDQLAVVTAPLAPQLVIAGAGSGKTTIMAARVVHAVAHHGLSPGAVLGLTFTNKAAGELADRVRRALDRLTPDTVTPGTATPNAAPTSDEVEAAEEMPTVTTYHAYAANLVRDHALRIGREPDTALLTEAGRWQLALRVVGAARGPFRHLDWSSATVARYVLDLDGELAEHLRDIDSVRRHDRALVTGIEALDAPVRDVCRVAEAAQAREELLDLVVAYRARKRQLDLLDFGDQVALAADIARSSPPVGAGERARFGVVFLDEYQDTGVAQRLLLSTLFGSGHPVTAVGDPCQSIYGWRGASVGNLLRFNDHFPTAAGEGEIFRPHYLPTSFRNAGRILDVANTVSAELRRPAPAARRTPVRVPELVPTEDSADGGDVRVALHRTVVDEVEWVAGKIAAAVHEDGVRPGQVAVLCRRRADFALVHERLVAHDLPVEVVGLGGLLAMPEVADVVAVLEVLADPTANPALVRILTGPRWRIGPRDLAALGRRAAGLAAAGGTAGGGDEADIDGSRALVAATSSLASGDPCEVVALADALENLGPADDYSPAAFARLRALDAELRGLRRLLGQPLVEAVSEVVTTIGLDVEIAASPDAVGPSRAANLAAFLDHAARFEGIEGESDLPAFLAYLAAARDVENGLDTGAVSAADTVKVLTVHKAKGLEWDLVAVPFLAEGTFPARRGRPRWTSRAQALPNDLRGDCLDLPAAPEWTSAGMKAFAAACQDQDRAEERRLAYVAVTRPRHRVLLSGHRWNRTRTTAAGDSPFLVEAREVCEAGNGTVEVWCDTDDLEDANPLTDADRDVAWPPAPDEEALRRRRRAAELVRTALAGEGPAAAEDELTPAEARRVQRWRWEATRLREEAQRALRPERVVPLPDSLSTTALVRVAEDPDGFARSLARPMPRRPDAKARRGTRFHLWVEQLLGARPLLDAAAVPGAGDAELPDDAELAELQAAFAASEYAERSPLAVEAPFELVLGGRVVRGRIDAVFATDRGYEVVDWKTGSSRAAGLQLAVYRLAWAGMRRVPPEAVSGAFLYVRTGEVERITDLPDAETLAEIMLGQGG